MIIKLKFHNNRVCVTRPYVDYGYWSSSINCKNDSDIENKLNSLLKDLNCKRIYDYGRPMMTTYPIYLNLLSDYVYYLLKFNNQILYNKYHILLENIHYDNIQFEIDNPIKKESKSNKRIKSISNKFTKRQSKDLFTGEVIYFYENLKTGECIKSINPDLLEELNAPKKKKIKKEKYCGVPMSAMTFSFKKK